MCGLVGIAGDLAFRDEKAIRRLLLLDYWRGMDATGFASVKAFDGAMRVAKIDSHPLTLFQMQEFKDACSGSASQIFLGHNRAATSGEKNEVNAHPFKYGDVVGAHNGTLGNWNKKDLEAELDQKFNVDSQALICAISRLGIEKTIKLLEEGITGSDGAWAIVWYNRADDTLNFIRNKHRPLWYAFSKDFKRIFWASEWRMIRNTAEDENYELYADKDGHRFFGFSDDVWYSFDMETLRKGSADRPKPKVKTLKGKEPVASSSNVGYHNPFGRRNRNTTANSSTTTSAGSSRSEKKSDKPNKDNVIHLYGDAAKPYADRLSERRFNDLAQGGCTWCSEKIKYGDRGILVYDRTNTILCKKCAHTEGDSDIPAAKLYVMPVQMKKAG